MTLSNIVIKKCRLLENISENFLLTKSINFDIIISEDSAFLESLSGRTRHRLKACLR